MSNGLKEKDCVESLRQVKNESKRKGWNERRRGVYVLLEGRPDGEAFHKLYKNLLLMMESSTF